MTGNNINRGTTGNILMKSEGDEVIRYTVALLTAHVSL